MSGTTRITVTLPTEQVEELRKMTDNISGYVAEAVARQIRNELLGRYLDDHEAEYGAFTEAEMADAEARLFGPEQSEEPAVAA
ncbi:type II toxin-antitoxin system CcdA family antitoxin [Streptomyces sp. NBC_00249]|uniref:type II toxin-antitoxin system CcdA family antitoxin n=1 Tax=Streptomyces sp. NBC_00249 TaxID=2975690 RepID=UPI0022568089|nr:type II toxin-antitoxin system CcdA family antitoxin [Streptomyces sp. NBC_00249]MCX5196032.1 type II toxin-antitoxin system CcdA family antitoxin [Streptomyces sp. NBC_00249]